MSNIKEFEILGEAREARAKKIAAHERSIERLRACTCGYPVIVMHNGHGHADVCPVAEMIGNPPRRSR